MSIPTDPLEFYLHPIVLLAFAIGFVIIVLGICAIKVPRSRKYLKPFFKIFYVLAMAPLYAVAGLIWLVTFSKINIFKKFKEIEFQQKFKDIYLEPTKTFEDMRLNPQRYHVWVGIFICVVLSFPLQLLMVTIAESFYTGQESIVFGILNPAAPAIVDPIRRWLMLATTGILVWVPTKFAIHFLAVKFHKYDNSDEPARPWYDKVRLLYLSWGYIIAADMIWAVGMCIALLFPTWEGMIFAWSFAVICGIIEAFLQYYSIRGLYKMEWFKAIFIWFLSMIPAGLTVLLLQGWLGPLIVNAIP